jgi:hypothetical protein
MPGTWTPLTNHPGGDVKRMLLLTDGRILCHLGDERWNILTPDNEGRYHNGTWSAESMHHSREYFGACVLSDGRVLVAFGFPPHAGPAPDWFSGDQTIEIFDPAAEPGRRWQLLPANPGWDQRDTDFVNICPMADGRRILVGIDYSSIPRRSYPRLCALYDFSSNTWQTIDTIPAVKDPPWESWVLLPDNSVFTVTGTRVYWRYFPDTGDGRWEPIPSSDHPWEFRGPGLLLPDGRIWISGIYGDTIFYNPVTNTWSDGPNFPDIIPGLDPPANADTLRMSQCILPDGRVFSLLSHYYEDSTPLCYEFNPLDHSFIEVPLPDVGRDRDLTHWGASVMLLPTGEVLMTYNGMGYVYSPKNPAEPQAAWRPQLESPTWWLTSGVEYTARGTLFNGISQAISNVPWRKIDTGTNYPIVKLSSVATGTVVYCRSYGHSSMGVATGSTPQSTNFKIPSGFPNGEADLSIIANGIESNRIRVNIVTFERIRDPYREVLQLIGNLADGPLFIIGPGGIRPVPPFGPNDFNFEKQFKEKILRAYRHIFTGLLLMHNDSIQPVESVKEIMMQQNGPFNSKREIDHGLFMLRELSIELDKYLGKMKEM